MPEFVHCLDLCKPFYQEAVRPIMESSFAHLPYAAAALGGGSEIKRLDDEISRDHDWGPFVVIFLNEEDLARNGDTILETLDRTLAPTFHGYQVGVKPNGREPWSFRRTSVTSLRELANHLNFNIDDEIEPLDWLTFPQHRLLDVVSGEVYHDDIGLQAFRDRFAYYPKDVWLYLLLASWGRIGQEEHLMGRAGSSGDEIGAAIIASRLVRDIMMLCFLMEKQYAHYPKLFGKAFGKLRCADELAPILRKIQLAQTWKDRERHFSRVWERLGAIHNALGITEPVQMTYASFKGRPYKVCGGPLFEAVRAQIKDPNLAQLAIHGCFGGINQVSDSTNILDNARWRPIFKKLYEMGAS